MTEPLIPATKLKDLQRQPDAVQKAAVTEAMAPIVDAEVNRIVGKLNYEIAKAGDTEDGREPRTTAALRVELEVGDAQLVSAVVEELQAEIKTAGYELTDLDYNRGTMSSPSKTLTIEVSWKE